MNTYRMRREQEEERARLRALALGVPALDMTPTNGGIVPISQQSVAQFKQSVSVKPSSVTSIPSHNGTNQ